MSKYIPGNQKHLSLEDRKYIEHSLNRGSSFKDIALILMQGSYYIFEYVCQLDVERSRKSGVPEQDYSDMPEAFSNVSAESLGGYMKAQFQLLE